MPWALLLAIMVGVAIVVQSSTVVVIQRSANFWLLLTVSNLVVATMCLSVFLSRRERGSLLDELARVPAMVLVPSLCGFVIISAMPTAIAKIGVFRAVMAVIACQILTSIVWDWQGGTPPNLSRIVGALLVVGGVLLVLRPSQ
jgi:transporter family-2 protein